MINDMLDLASIEAGHVVLEIEPIDLRVLLDGVGKLFTERARGGQIALSVECPEAIGSIDMDKRRAKQILFNLMSNALKFTPRAGTVVLGVRRESDGAALWVADSGVGIPESERDRIFDKFYTGEHRNRGRAGAGAGPGQELRRTSRRPGRDRLGARRGHDGDLPFPTPPAPGRVAGAGDPPGLGKLSPHAVCFLSRSGAVQAHAA